MKIRFWGTRGSIPKPRPQMMKYGGDTACVELRSASGQIVVLDCGSGAHDLGRALAAEPNKPAGAALLFSHTHWDHIQGLPFFAPLFIPGNEWDIYAPRGLSQSLRETLSGQMQYSYFPISLEDMGATIRYHELVEGDFTIGDIRVSARYLDHPALTLGYRFEVDGVAVVYACDHESVARKAIPDADDLAGSERGHVEFLKGADLVIHDAQYTSAEYPDKVGWGHSTFDYAAEVCNAAGVGRLLVTHHDPERTDDQLDRIIADLSAASKAAGRTMAIGAAAVGVVVELSGEDGASDPRRAGRDTSAGDADAALGDALVGHAIALDTLRPEADAILSAAAEAEGLPVAAPGAPHSLAVADARTAHALRAGPKAGADAPGRILVADKDDIAAGRVGPDANYMVWPFSQAYAQTRLRAAVLRSTCKWVRARLPEDEDDRLAALDHLAILDTEPEERFDRITRMTADAFDLPVALVTLIDRDRQWMKSCFGADTRETSREVAFCAHTILEDRIMVVPDTLLDPRFADNPMVAGGPRVRFYAGRPLRSPSGLTLGTLCLIDMRPRLLNERQLSLFEQLGDLAEAQLNAAN
ncbi:MAG: MBL fold metallo-hydrolase [Pseudomonadota bacterium]